VAISSATTSGWWSAARSRLYRCEAASSCSQVQGEGERRDQVAVGREVMLGEPHTAEAELFGAWVISTPRPKTASSFRPRGSGQEKRPGSHPRGSLLLPHPPTPSPPQAGEGSHGTPHYVRGLKGTFVIE